MEEEFERLMRAGTLSPEEQQERKERRFRLFFWGGSTLAIVGAGIAFGLSVARYSYHPMWHP